MEALSNALPATPEQWAAAITTILLAIIGLFRKRKTAGPEHEREPEH